MKMANVGSLFRKTKNDPDFLATQERVRQSLLKTLSRAIKEVQLLFTELGEGGRVGDCRATQRLCTRFENVLRHGQKVRWFGKNTSFWPLVLQISRKQAIEYINGLQYAQTGTGKCRAWIRMAVNECSLESYIGVICQNESLRSQHYEVHAFMRDEDVVGPLQQLLAGLSQINFTITVDTASLEFEAVPEALQPPLQLRVPQHLLDNRDRLRRKRRHRASSKQHNHQLTPIEDSSDSSDETLGDQEDEEREEGEGIVERRGIKLREESTVRTGGDVIVCEAGYSNKEREKDASKKEGTSSSNSSNLLSSLTGNTGALCSEVYMSVGDGGGGGEKVVESDIGEEGKEGEGEVEGGSGTEVSVGDGGGSGEKVVESDIGGEEGKEGEGEVEEGSGTEVSVGDGGEGGEKVVESDIGEEGKEGEGEVEGGSGTEVSVGDGGGGGEKGVESDIGGVEGEEVEGGSGTEESRSNQEVEEKIIPVVECVPEDEVVSNHLENDCHREGGEKEGEEEGEGEGGRGGEEEEEERGQDGIELAANGGYTDTTAPTLLEEVCELEVEQEAETPTADTTATCSFDAAPESHLHLPIPFDHEPGNMLSKLDWSLKNLFDLQEQDFDSEDQSNDIPPPHITPLCLGSSSLFDSPEPSHLHTHTSTPPPSPPHPPVRDELDARTTDTHTPHSSPSHPPQSHHHRNPFDSPRSSPASPTSSDFFNEATPTSFSHHQMPSDEGWRGSRADSLEWSMYVEQTLEKPDAAALLSSLQLDEDHYSAEMGIPELQEAILHLKRDLSSSLLPSSDQHTLRRTIIQLQLKLHKKKEEQENSAPHEVVSGHKFVRQPRQTRVLRGLSCVACRKRVRGLIREWYQCKTCQSVCHKKCLPSVIDQCVIPGDDVKYILEVCPEAGLTAQQFRCIKCNRAFNQALPVEVRLCDYDGLYYCPYCHNNDMAVIPARVMHNWDFTTREVCRQCSSLLFHLSSRPLLRVQEVNPLLYIHIQDLVEVEALRKDILQMKKYFVECKVARDSQLLHKLDMFPNFKEHSSLLTLHEMVEIQNGSLLPVLKDVHRTFAQHIKSDCQVCSERGHICNLCGSTEPLYPFDHDITLCPHCSAIYHKNCFCEVSSCPKCRRTKTVT